MIWFIFDLVMGCILILCGVWIAVGIIRGIRRTWKDQ